MTAIKNPPPGNPVPGQAPREGYGYSAHQAGDLARTWHTLVEKAWVIVLSAAICLGLGFAYTKHAPVLYSSTATIQAEEDQPNIFRMQMVQIKDLQAVDYLQTVAQSLTSRPLLERVADTNNLWTDPRFYQATRDTAAALGGRDKPLASPTFAKAAGAAATATITAQPASLSVPESSPASFSVGVAGNPEPALQWYRNGVPIPGATNQAWTIPAASLSDNWDSFRAVAVNTVSNINYSVTSAVATLRVTPNTKPIADTGFDRGGPPSRARALFMLDKMIKVRLRRGTRLIDITVTHRVPELTEKIANSIVNEYVNERAQREDTTIGLASKSLAKEAERLRKKLGESQNALQDYVEQSKASSLDERQNTVVAKLKELSTKATEAKSTRIRTETEYAQILNLGTNMEALMTVPTVAKDPTVQALQLSLIKAEDDFAALLQRYKEKHPKYIQAKTQIAELRGNIAAAVTNAVQTLKATLDSAKAAEEALNQAMQAQEASALELSKLSIQYSVLSREVESDRALYDAVLKGMKEASVTKETQQTGIIRVVQPAFVPDLPIWPKKAAIMAVSGLGGIFLGVLIIMGLRVSDTSIKTVDEAERMLGLSVFSAVPHIGGLNNSQNPLVVVEKAKSEGAEAFRTLRTSLTMVGRAEDRRVFLFTSAMPREGKTFCSLNYAASLAQLGLKTLIIDADLRRPCIEAGLLGEESASPGITDYLTGQKNLQEVVRAAKVENLFFISAGATATNPAELLAKDGLDALIKSALQHYDRVVLDSAPVNAVSDTLLMLKSVQTVCLVVRAARTSSRYVLRCVQLFQGAEGSISGIVLNQMPRRRGLGYGAYYDYRYHGKYGKEGVYGAR